MLQTLNYVSCHYLADYFNHRVGRCSRLFLPFLPPTPIAKLSQNSVASTLASALITPHLDYCNRLQPESCPFPLFDLFLNIAHVSKSQT